MVAQVRLNFALYVHCLFRVSSAFMSYTNILAKSKNFRTFYIHLAPQQMALINTEPEVLNFIPS